MALGLSTLNKLESGLLDQFLESIWGLGFLIKQVLHSCLSQSLSPVTLCKFRHWFYSWKNKVSIMREITIQNLLKLIF